MNRDNWNAIKAVLTYCLIIGLVFTPFVILDYFDMAIKVWIAGNVLGVL